MILKLEDFRLLPAREARRDPRLRRAYFNLQALLEEVPDPAARAAELEASELYHPDHDFQEDGSSEFVMLNRQDDMMGMLNLEHHHSKLLGNDAIHPHWRGRGYGSVLCALSIAEADKLGFPILEGHVFDPDNKASWQRCERLRQAGLATRQPDDEFNGKPVRVYHMPTQYPASTYYQALLKPLL